MNITKFSINRPVGISMIVAFFVVLGLFSYYRIGVELLPNINIPYITVHVRYPGASAESVEQQIVKIQIKSLDKRLLSGSRRQLHIRRKQLLPLVFRYDATGVGILRNNPVIHADKK